MTRITTIQPDTLAEAASLLEADRLVAFPTETVYGLGANALSDQAVSGIFEAKGRPSFNPLILHCYSLEQVSRYAELNERAEKCAQHFWPGPLTLILRQKAHNNVSQLATAGLETVAIRVPDHPIAQKLLRKLDFPLVAPSANRSGTVSPTAPAHVVESLGGRVDMILAAGNTKIGLESTILDLSGDTPVILRPGHITQELLEQVLEQKIAYAELDKKDRPVSPGQLLKHYAPETPVRLNAIDLKPGEALLAFGSTKFMGIHGGGKADDLPETMRRNLSKTQDLEEAAANLFRMLRELDKPAHQAIAVMAIPQNGIGFAINERLKRATAGSNAD